MTRRPGYWLVAWYGLLAVHCGEIAIAAPSAAPPLMTSIMTRRIDQLAVEWLASERAPSVSIAIVRQGRVVYARAYGLARLQPARRATPQSRYAIASVTKEFTAAGVLMLAEQGRLQLDESLARWYADLGPASTVTVRQLLNHTSGIRDFWPQDFITPEMSRPTTRDALINEWVRRPLDFDPGTQWQYSNTGYVLAGALIEKITGGTLTDFLHEHLFRPLGMLQVTDSLTTDPDRDAVGYTRYGLGDPHPAPREGAGWLSGAANLAMQPEELARWDVSLMDHTLLREASYASLTDPVQLSDGTLRPYGLGLDVETTIQGLRLGHSGSGSGFLAENRFWPAERTAVVILTNSDWTSPAGLLDRIAFLILPPTPSQVRVQHLFESLQRGRLPRASFTAVGLYYFTTAVLRELEKSLAPMGRVRTLDLDYEDRRGGMITRRWRIACAHGRLLATERSHPDGALDEFLITPAPP